PRASSSSRNASRPASEVTVAPWNSSFNRRSKATRSSAPCASPVASSIRRPLHGRQTLALRSRFAHQLHRTTRVFGTSGTRLLAALLFEQRCTSTLLTTLLARIPLEELQSARGVSDVSLI